MPLILQSWHGVLDAAQVENSESCNVFFLSLPYLTMSRTSEDFENLLLCCIHVYICLWKIVFVLVSCRYYEVPHEEDKELCPGARCWDDLFYPFSGRYISDSNEYVFGTVSFAIIFFVGYGLITRPWWWVVDI